HGIRANVWEYALRKAPYEARYRTALERDFKWLLSALHETGWRYSMTSTDWDNSCTQYGVLGIWAAERAGFSAGDAFWAKMSRHFRGVQNDDGGWGYVAGSSSSANMATAGLASMFLVFDYAYGRKHAFKAGQPNPFAEGDARAVLDAMERGMTWLGKADGQRNNAYYLYGIERAAVAGGRKYLGGVDWFAEGAEGALRAQAPDGSFPLGYTGEIGTALTTLFLVYGGAPVAIDKLQYGEGTAWNLNPRDAANVARSLWQAYERPVNWHTVSLSDPVEEWEAPILYISGFEAAKFNDADVARLRSYVQRGGTIFAEAADGGKGFTASMEKLVGRIRAGAALSALPADHALFTALRQAWTNRPHLRGASDGTRTWFVFSDDYLAADWQMNRTESDAFPLALSLLLYVTDLGALAGRFSTAVPPGEGAEARDGRLIVARARFGSDDDWDAAEATWAAVAPYARHEAGVTVVEAGPVKLTDPIHANLLHLTGRRQLKRSDAGRAVQRRVGENGEKELVDAFAGSPAFAESARRELEAMFGALAPLEGNAPLAVGRFEGGVDLTRGVRYALPARRALRRAGLEVDRAHLKVARVGGRAAVVFSAYDLSAALAGVRAWGASGYVPASARRVVTNVLASIAEG
ncbi:MAG: DUF4159 domain-containing protein, partial [Myxococcales bacterium]|nr:DUF4159 domain-containing protein [Myxococcales bacterium]